MTNLYNACKNQGVAQDLGPTQVKCRLLISNIFDAMNFQHFSENAKNARNSLHQKW